MKRKKAELSSELLILPDGRVLVQNLTQPMAELLRRLNPEDRAITPRARKLRKP